MCFTDDTTRPVDDTRRASQSVRLVLLGLLPGDTTCVVLNGRSLALGRSHDCDVPIDAPSVSRRHAELFWQGGVLNIRDLGSANGTYVDSHRVEQVPCAAGTIVRLGGWIGGIEEIADEPLAAAQLHEVLPRVFGGAVLARALRPAAPAARSQLPIVLIGTTGVGKECVARAIHEVSGRRGPFYAVNCAAVPPSLAEAEFFGHARGAFTGAQQARTGHLLSAHAGTLLLDEVTDLPLGIQPLLLRVLDQREVVPLGQTQARAFDARVVSASQVPLTELVEEGRFRADLAQRLSGLVVQLPSLTERRLDIPRLFQRFLTCHAQGDPPELSPSLGEWLCDYTWPGNVRELALLAQQLLALHPGEAVLGRSHLPSSLRSARVRARPRGDKQREQLFLALEQADGNLSRAARSLGISRQRAYRLLDSARGRRSR
jgi:DNA-binding NtrC family response regulator